MIFDLEGFRYYIGNPSAWDTYDEAMSERMRKAADAIASLTDEVGRLNNWIALHRGDTASLNNEVELMRSHWQDAETRASSAEAQVERLRAALERIAAHHGGNGVAPLKDIARAALQSTEGSGG